MTGQATFSLEDDEDDEDDLAGLLTESPDFLSCFLSDEPLPLEADSLEAALAGESADGLSLAAASAASAASALPASVGYSAEGYGPTLAAAQQNARKTLQGDEGPCTGVFTYADGQLADGTWWADVSGECAGPR